MTDGTYMSYRSYRSYSSAAAGEAIQTARGPHFNRPCSSLFTICYFPGSLLSFGCRYRSRESLIGRKR